MDTQEVTLSERARALCESLGIPEIAVKRARTGAGSSWEEGREYLIVKGALPEGGEVLMKCWPHQPTHVVTFRPIDH